MWQPRSLREDRLLEIGPFEEFLLARNYSFLRFERAGRVPQVAVMPALIIELEKALQADLYAFHFLEGRPKETTVSHALIALGPEGVTNYAIDLDMHGAQEIEGECRRLRFVARRALLQGGALVAVGIPLVLIGIGVPVVLKGRAIFRLGRALVQNVQSQIALMNECSAFIERLPYVSLLQGGISDQLVHFQDQVKEGERYDS